MNVSSEPEEVRLRVARGGELRVGLKRVSLRSGTITLITQCFAILLQVLSTVILARLLTPADFGVVAAVLTVSTFARLFQQAGLSAATIQAKRISHDQASALFWMNALVGACLTVLVAAASPAVALFFQIPELVPVNLAVSSNFLLAGFGVQHTALLQRNMCFASLGVVWIFSAFAGAVTSVVLAIIGLGYWALVWGTLVTSALQSLGAWMATGWAPGWPKKSRGTMKLLRFGLNVTGFELANYFARNLDNVLIGRVWGPSALGFYSRAYSLLLLPINSLRSPLLSVAFPALSRLGDQPKLYRQYYCRYVAILAFLSMPLAAVLFATSESAILLLLGEKWLPAAKLFSILALTAFIQPVATSWGLVLQASGHSGRYLIWGIWNALAVACGFAIGIGWGPRGVAICYCIVNYLMLHPSLCYGFKNTPVEPRDFYVSVYRPAVASVASVALVLLVREVIASWGVLLQLGFCGGVFTLGYLGVFVLIPGGAQELRNYVSYRTLFRPGSVPQEPRPESL